MQIIRHQPIDPANTLTTDGDAPVSYAATLFGRSRLTGEVFTLQQTLPFATPRDALLAAEDTSIYHRDFDLEVELWTRQGDTSHLVFRQPAAVHLVVGDPDADLSTAMRVRDAIFNQGFHTNVTPVRVEAPTPHFTELVEVPGEGEGEIRAAAAEIVEKALGGGEAVLDDGEEAGPDATRYGGATAGYDPADNGCECEHCQLEREFGEPIGSIPRFVPVEVARMVLEVARDAKAEAARPAAPDTAPHVHVVQVGSLSDLLSLLGQPAKPRTVH